MKRSVHLAALTAVLLALVLPGCEKLEQQSNKGTEAAAREYFDAQMVKVMAAGDRGVYRDNSIPVGLSFGFFDMAAPLGYEVSTVIPAKPCSIAASKCSTPKPQGWENWPAFQFNVVFQMKSASGGTLDKAERFYLTWNAVDEKWEISSPPAYVPAGESAGDD